MEKIHAYLIQLIFGLLAIGLFVLAFRTYSESEGLAFIIAFFALVSLVISTIGTIIYRRL